MVYNNIFFVEEKISKGKGHDNLQYTGKVYEHVTTETLYAMGYDPTCDLIISCNQCFSRDFAMLEKVGKSKRYKTKAGINEKITENNIRDIHKVCRRSYHK